MALSCRRPERSARTDESPPRDVNGRRRERGVSGGETVLTHEIVASRAAETHLFRSAAHRRADGCQPSEMSAFVDVHYEVLFSVG